MPRTPPTAAAVEGGRVFGSRRSARYSSRCLADLRLSRTGAAPICRGQSDFSIHEYDAKPVPPRETQTQLLSWLGVTWLAAPHNGETGYFSSISNTTDVGQLSQLR